MTAWQENSDKIQSYAAAFLVVICVMYGIVGVIRERGVIRSLIWCLLSLTIGIVWAGPVPWALIALMITGTASFFLYIDGGRILRKFPWIRAILVGTVLGALLPFAYSREGSFYAKRYCESLLPDLENVRLQTGQYPKKLPVTLVKRLLAPANARCGCSCLSGSEICGYSVLNKKVTKSLFGNQWTESFQSYSLSVPGIMVCYTYDNEEREWYAGGS